MLIPQTPSLHVDHQSIFGEDLEGLSKENQHGFLNISVTPLECSVVCHTWWAKHVFEPVINSLPPQKSKGVSGRTESYIVLSVLSSDLDAASRVLELSSPLAVAGIPIFFVTTYYSDFILVPAKERPNVIDALLQRGFKLSDNDASFIISRKNSRGYHSTSPPGSPPSSYEKKLQTRTFQLLKKRDISPHVVQGLELVQCSGREVSQLADAYGHRSSVSRQTCTQYRDTWMENVDTKFYAAVVSLLVSQPRFASVTLAQGDAPSLLVDKSLLGMFNNTLVGDMDAILVPIFLDLVSLPSEVTGIVCGVSGRLVQDMKMKATSELSYLSTARAGVVILPELQATRALGILMTLLEQAEG